MGGTQITGKLKRLVHRFSAAKPSYRSFIFLLCVGLQGRPTHNILKEGFPMTAEKMINKQAAEIYRLRDPYAFDADPGIS